MSVFLAGRCECCGLKWSGPVSEIPFVETDTGIKVFACHGCGATICEWHPIEPEEVSNGRGTEASVSTTSIG